MFEASARVPMVIVPFNVPAMANAAGRVVDAITSHVDVLPTILDLASGGAAPPPAYARGASLVPFLLDAPPQPPPPRKDFAFVEFHSNLASTGQFSLRQGDLKMTQYGHTWPWWSAAAGFSPRLFNVSADPLEQQDLAADRPDLVAAMTATLEAELGGVGAIARIDAEQMHENLALYKQFFAAKYNASALLALFEASFVGISPAELSAAVLAWSGSPLL